MTHVDPARTPPNRRRTYLLVFVALAVMTAIEVFIAQTPGIPVAPVLLTMSLAKALLVILYFMHLRYDSRWYSLIFFAPFLLVIPLLIVSQQ